MNRENLWFADILDENTPARTDWDRHAKDLWTFFPESDKGKVAHWLYGEWVRWLSNADFGGGWYAHVPGSVVIDMSPISLENNPSSEKILFDLDTIGPDNKLPLRDRCLETVTMTSVWQYLRKPEALLEDLKRVLVPGRTVYVINQDGAWLLEHKQQPDHGEWIMWQIHAFGYDVELVQIPIGKSAQLQHWHAVKVTMPQTQYELFPVQREYSAKIHRLLVTDTSLYHEDQHLEYTEASLALAKGYAQAEYIRTQYLQTMLHTYPITRASRELVQEAGLEAQNWSKKGNAPVLLWSNMPKIATDMYQEGDLMRLEMCTYAPSKTTGGSVSWSGWWSICGVHTAGHEIIPLLMAIENKTLLYSIDEKMLRELIRFVQHYALNDFTREKQEIIRHFLRVDYQEFLNERDKYKEAFSQKYYKEEPAVIERELRVAEYEGIFLPSKQTRMAEVFLARKRKVDNGNILAIGTGTLSPLTEEEKVMFLERLGSKRY